MKLTNSQLQNIILEELEATLADEELPNMYYDPNEPETVLGWEDEGLGQTVVNPQIIGTALPGLTAMARGQEQTSAISGVPPWVAALQGLDPDWDPNEVLEEDKTQLHQIVQEELQKILEQPTPEQLVRRERAAKFHSTPTDVTIDPSPITPESPAVVQPPDRREYPPHMGLISTLFKDAGPDQGLQYAKKMFPELSELNILYTALVAAPRWKAALKKSKASKMP